uniref:C2H2-type domain-containing protein n=1 Tax=Megaselia scalaris TaxID=36166 RepID=T1GX70_MEGSC
MASNIHSYTMNRVWCPICNGVFITMTTYINHINQHKNHNLQYTCPSCRQQFRKLCRLKRHFQRCEMVSEEFRTGIHEQDRIVNDDQIVEEIEYIHEPNFEPVDDNNGDDYNEFSNGDEDNNDEFNNRNDDSCIVEKVFLKVSKLYGKMAFPKNLATDVISFVNEELVSTIFECILRGNCNREVIENMAFNCRSGLDAFASEYKFRKELINRNLYIPPVKFSILPEDILLKESYGYFIPINEMLAAIFEKREELVMDMLFTAANNSDSVDLNTQHIEYITQGATWQKQKVKFQFDAVIPIIIYQDDFEVCNPLGSKNFSYGLYSNFKQICNELENVENNGLALSYIPGNKVIGCNVCAIAGDNLALNSILGKKRNFVTDYCCRICVATIQQIEDLVEEDYSLLRTDENIHLGCTSKTPLADIDSFSETDMLSVDPFHDFFEGIVHAELCYILDYCFTNYVDIEILNTIKREFKYYNDFDKKNLSVDLKKEHILKKKLKMSGSEIACFLKYLPIYIGEFVPKNDEVWLFLGKLIEMIDSSLSTFFNTEKINNLQKITKEHHTTYKVIFGPKTLTPKHHFITHYGTHQFHNAANLLQEEQFEPQCSIGKIEDYIDITNFDIIDYVFHLDFDYTKVPFSKQFFFVS